MTSIYTWSVISEQSTFRTENSINITHIFELLHAPVSKERWRTHWYPPLLGWCPLQPCRPSSLWTACLNPPAPAPCARCENHSLPPPLCCLQHKSHYSHFESQKSIYRTHKINTRRSWRYMEVLWSEMISLCKKLNTIYNFFTCNPDETNHSFKPVRFSELLELVHQIKLKHLKLFSAEAAQIYSIKTHFQTPDSHADSKWAQIPAYLILWWMNWFSSSSSNSHWTEETDRLGPKTDEPLIWACVNRGGGMVPRGLYKILS